MRHIPPILLGSLLTFIVGCEVKGEGNDDVGDEAAQLCKAGCEEPIACLLWNDGTKEWVFTEAFCADDKILSEVPEERLGQILAVCRELSGMTLATFSYESLACSSSAPSSCNDWAPATHISHSANETIIDYALIVDIIADPSPLNHCDTGRLVESQGTPGLLLKDLSSGDLLDELGLQDGDSITRINEYVIRRYADALAAALELSGEGPQQHIEVEVVRDGATVTLDYEVVP